MFSVVPVKSRTFFQFLIFLANKYLLCRSWEGAQQTAIQAGHGNIPNYECDTQFRDAGWLEPCLSLFCEFESSLVQEVKLIWEFSLFWGYL